VKKGLHFFYYLAITRTIRINIEQILDKLCTLYLERNPMLTQKCSSYFVWNNRPPSHDTIPYSIHINNRRSLLNYSILNCYGNLNSSKPTLCTSMCVTDLSLSDFAKNLVCSREYILPTNCTCVSATLPSIKWRGPISAFEHIPIIFFKQTAWLNGIVMDVLQKVCVYKSKKQSGPSC
jgi:hypothetical protein